MLGRHVTKPDRGHFHSGQVWADYSILLTTLIILYRQVQGGRLDEQRTTSMRVSIMEDLSDLYLPLGVSRFNASCKGCHNAESPSVSMSFLPLNQKPRFRLPSEEAGTSRG